ncbi:hypothetical protein FQR65_LT03687 [Abscondita terminalis]|nr:hypothetical protein FQR65_LT03687 [Abscondita terminalis]
MIQIQKNVGINVHITVITGEDLVHRTRAIQGVGIRKSRRLPEDKEVEVEAAVDTIGQGDLEAKVVLIIELVNLQLLRIITVVDHTLEIDIDRDVQDQRTILRNISSTSSDSSKVKVKGSRPIEHDGNIKEKNDSSQDFDIPTMDAQVLEELNADSFAQKAFSSKNKKLPNTIVIDLKKQTIKVPQVEPVEPDSIFHHNSNTFLELFSNYFGVKNVFYGLYNSKSVVLKKLAHNFEIDNFELNINNFGLGNFNEKIISSLTDSGVNFKVCSKVVAEKLTSVINELTIDSVHFWTILKINGEPLMLQLIKAEDGWPVPFYFGACGRLIVESHCGKNLNAFADYDWYLRSKLALQLLRAVKNFTESHQEFRFYLTDISPDNIAIDASMKLTFIDLENVVIAGKTNSSLKVHFSEDFGEDFAFSERDLCDSSISDHNYFAICKVISIKSKM